MVKQVERSSIDLRYESCRLKNPVTEKVLLASISQNGVREPLKGVEKEDSRILLDGFKRFRCAKKLSIDIIPFISFSDDEAVGIIELIRSSNTKTLNILEQARLIDELRNKYELSYSEIALQLEKSKSWVAMRAGLIDQMSESVKEKIFGGKFPVYSFMYSLRKFMRLNDSSKKEVDEFVDLTSGEGFSTRDIDLLAQGYFRGNEDFRNQIKNGDIHSGLQFLKQSHECSSECSSPEQKLIKELQIARSYINRIIYASKEPNITSNNFFSQAHLLASGILRHLPKFKEVLEKYHAR